MELKSLFRLFEKEKVLSFDEIAEKFDLAHITIRRALVQAGYYSSYNHNSKFYTLHSIPKFDQYGIWEHHRASFTKHKTLDRLLKFIIENSEAGMSVNELELIVKVKVLPLLIKLVRCDMLKRVRNGREFFYFHGSNKRKLEKQIRNRLKDKEVVFDEPGAATMKIQELSRTITTLLELIRTDVTNQKDLIKYVRKRDKNILPEFVTQVCRKYKLHLKKN